MSQLTALAQVVQQGQELVDLIKGGGVREMQSSFDAKMQAWNDAVQRQITRVDFRKVSLYVDKNGSDTNTGESKSTPFLTLDKALSLCRDSYTDYQIFLGAGDFSIGINTIIPSYSKVEISGVLGDLPIQTNINYSGYRIQLGGEYSFLELKGVKITRHSHALNLPPHFDVPIRVTGLGCNVKLGVWNMAGYRKFSYESNKPLVNVEITHCDIVAEYCEFIAVGGAYKVVENHDSASHSVISRSITLDAGVTL